MMDKNSENSSKGDSSKLLEEDKIHANFKLLYRNTTTPERDKSSGASSDEETTSSSLVPIPDTLKHFRNKSKWTLCDTGEIYENDTTRLGRDLGKTPEKIINSLEELRKKYTLKNESTVAMKVTSANLMLDDILNSANITKAPADSPQSKSKKEEFRQKNEFESETSTTETSHSQMQLCPHITAHCHPPIPVDFYSPMCSSQCSHTKHIDNLKDKDQNILKRDLESSQRKKTLIERIQGLQNMFRIQSVYRTFQKSRNPFTKSRQDYEDSNNIQQGIPGIGCREDSAIESQPVCKCKHKNISHQFQKKFMLDLVESSEMSQTETKSAGRDIYSCNCSYKRCSCPEVIPQCFCVQHIQISEKAKQNSPSSDNCTRSNENEERVTDVPFNNTTEITSLTGKENEDYNKRKPNSVRRNFEARWKHCSKERNIIERTDIYYFDHGNSAFYQTTDNHPMRYTECLVERTDEYATKFWAEIFGTIEIGLAFLISFILQFYRFLFTSIIRSLTVGLLQIFSDYFFKPLLTVLFNGIIQPCLILVYNIATSVRDLCLPISEIFGFFAKELALILKSCRLVDINHNRESSCNCGNKV